MSTSKIHSAARTATIAALIGASVFGGGFAANAATHAAPGGSHGVGTLYGNPQASARYWQRQHTDDCAEMATADVIGELTGQEPTEQQIVAVAERTPSQVHPGTIYSPSTDADGTGTAGQDIPVLLARYRISSAYTDAQVADQTGIGTGVEALAQDLGGGHKVIALVNAQTLWQQPGETQANHAVVVTGIDSATGTVFLNDSGIDGGRDEQVPINVFVSAWNTSADAMVVTAAN